MKRFTAIAAVIGLVSALGATPATGSHALMDARVVATGYGANLEDHFWGESDQWDATQPPPATASVASSHGSVDADLAAGRIAADASASGWDTVGARGEITDVIVLSEPATVRVVGHVTAHASTSGSEARAGAGVLVRLVGRGCPWTPDGAFCGYASLGTGANPHDSEGSVDEAFAWEFDLPAGRTTITIDGDASASTTAFLGSSSARSDTDVVFHVEVPTTVVAGSVSGLLPIVGGRAANTPRGSGVLVSPGNAPVEITFGQVEAAGETVVATSPNGPPLPDGFRLGDPPTYYDLSTSALWDPDAGATVCIRYSGISFSGAPELWHYEADAWVNVTTSVDAVNQTVCGRVSSFSPFALVTSATADTAPPAIQCASPDDAWHRENVVLDCTASDAASGLADPADGAFSLTTSVADGEEDANAATGTRVVCDVAGNCATAGPIAGIKVDRKAPSLDAQDVSVNATSPSGALVSFAVDATDSGSGVLAASCSPSSGTLFAIGDTVVSCSARDHAGNTASAQFVVHVKSAGEQLDELISLVQSLNLQRGIENSLDAKLQNAQKALESHRAGDKATACNVLGAFENEVRAQDGGALTTAQATNLRAAAAAIKAAIGC